MRLFQALRSRDYRRFYAGQSASLIGNWMTQTATAWLAYELTGSPFMLGVVLFAQQIPVLLLAPVAGTFGDRMDRRRLFLWLQTACALQAAALAALTVGGVLTVGWLVGMSLVRGLINSAEFPTRQSLIIELVRHRDDLPNAIALNSSLFNLARLVGPTCAGLVIVTLGPGWCYALDALSCVPILLIMVGLQRKAVPRDPTDRPARPWAALAEGVRHVVASPRLRTPLFITGVVAMSGFAAGTLAPVIARDLLNGDARTLGYLHAAVGLGALLTAIYLGSRRSKQGLANWVGRGALLLATGQAVCALAPTRTMTLLGMVLCGSGIVFAFAGSNTLLQSFVADGMRSRVMGLFAMAQSLNPLGSLAVGALAATFVGPRLTILLAASVCAAGGAVFLHLIRTIMDDPKQEVVVHHQNRRPPM